MQRLSGLAGLRGVQGNLRLHRTARPAKSRHRQDTASQRARAVRLWPLMPRAYRVTAPSVIRAKGSECAITIERSTVVMAGLNPAIHVIATAGDADNRVDERVTPAHDEVPLVRSTTTHSCLRRVLRLHEGDVSRCQSPVPQGIY